MKELLYALPPGMENAGEQWGLIPSHMAWRIVPGPRLIGVGLRPSLQGGAMYIACAEDPGPGDPLPCCRQIAAECKKRRLDKVICDFEGDPPDHARRLAGALGKTCAQNSLSLYLPEDLSDAAPDCHVLVSSVVTAQTLERRLSAALERYGPDRVALAVDAGATDLLLPALSPGAPMAPDALRALMERVEPAVFFDRGLCAHYFTYMITGGEAHFILFDTPQSVRAKLDTAQRLGIPSALMAAPQVADWLEEIFT